ncbi:unnamed protein product [Caenorhabditis bovis]|uniref:T20D4.11-like domain-containing protein n=1 Tax=Caenorhabditis bovis TaxID=2654633 RepID=A0A8S1EBP2_9PELO|nr:unnamed protein product [Caenorhabditis bovis]
MMSVLFKLTMLKDKQKKPEHQMMEMCQIMAKCYKESSETCQHDLRDSMKKKINACKLVKLIQKDFRDCFDSMKNSNCPEAFSDISLDNPLTCENVFGKQPCLKDEMIQYCSQETWEQFKKAAESIIGENVKCD